MSATTSPTTRSGHGRAFRAIAIAEACSWAGLVVGMFFKYVVVGSYSGDIEVRIFGPVHGAMFVGYLVVTFVVARALHWDARTVVLALVASVPPLCTLWFERWAARTGRLDAAAPASAVAG